MERGARQNGSSAIGFAHSQSEPPAEPRRTRPGTRAWLRRSGLVTDDQSFETPETVRANIRRILALEAEAARRRSLTDRLADAIGGFVGTFPFVALHAVLIGLWVAINLHLLPWRPFDPYPFSFLATVLSLEGVILTAFVLMKQRRMSRLSDHRDHFDLQVNLLTEREVSLVIEMLDRLTRRVGVPEGTPQEAMDLSRTSATEELEQELRRHMSDGDPLDG